MNKINHLYLKEATKCFKKFKAVDQVNLEVEKGEFLTILGPSGSGKTTMLKLIAGFEDLTLGKIFLNGQDITRKKPHQREIGMVFQNYALFPHMTVEENIAYPLKLRKFTKQEIKQKVQDVLELVDLIKFSKSYPSKLSGGQQQRVALARAIVFNPPLLLLDEPLAALDKNLREKMQLEIKHIQQRVGITTICVTHDQTEALTMSDRICVMNNGKIEQVATPNEIYQTPKNKFVAEFIGEINLIESKIDRTENNTTVLKSTDDANQIFYAKGSEGFNKNNKVFIGLRPENIHLVKNSHSFENTIKVKVCEKIYLGDTFKVRTKTRYGKDLYIKVPVYRSSEVEMGSEIMLGWDSEDAVIISA